MTSEVGAFLPSCGIQESHQVLLDTEPIHIFFKKKYFMYDEYLPV